MYVESDSVVYAENKGEPVYVGNVKASQGSLEVTGDKMIINQEKGKADQMIIYGSPARLKQTPDGGVRTITAWVNGRITSLNPVSLSSMETP